MVENDLFLEPTKYYQHGLKDTHKQNIEDYFNDLTQKSGISPEENKATCQKYYAKEKELNESEKKLGSTKGLSTFLLIIGILLAVAIIGIVILVLRSKKLKNKITDLETKVNKLSKEVKKLKAEAEAQVAPLNALFTDKMTFDLIHKSAPIFTFDDHISSDFMNRAINQFGYKEDLSIVNSTLDIQSGYLNNEPFFIRQYYHMEMVPEVYRGTLIITYTKSVSDGNGGTRTVTVTQTLVAHVTKPKPTYGVHSELVLLSENAPKLCFHREPTTLCSMDDKGIERYIDKVEKDEQRRAQKAVKHGESYTKMSNTKFEAFFNSSGRNNEVEYRMLFTPLAQTNLSYHFRQNAPYKDDIYYSKDKCINTIISSHSQSIDYTGGAYNYYHFDYEVIKKKFIDYNEEVFNGFYYDFLPLLNIPLFQQNSSNPYTGPNNYGKKHAIYQLEEIANKIDPEIIKHPNSSTDAIVKADVIAKGSGEKEVIEVTAHSFMAVDEVEFVPTMGGDGHMHPVPVHWYRYDPLESRIVYTLDKYKDNVGSNDSNNTIINYRGLCLQKVKK